MKFYRGAATSIQHTSAPSLIPSSTGSDIEGECQIFLHTVYYVVSDDGYLW